ncbi:DUF3613 domain-containing protein [uncultured Comamonas sp.]|uniref:DUF3613 domain-containing protein n=1 Tax=uncultured Comamonas sp. TaxID=114710 RepID=UPI0037484BC7
MSPSRSLPHWRLVLLGLAASVGLTALAQAQSDASRTVAAVEVQPPAPTDAVREQPAIAPPAVSAPAMPQPYMQLQTSNGKPVLQDPEARRKRVLVVGRATERLLAMQVASPGVHPRPIDGEQARRSYQRYLKSFETKIPERFEAGVDVKQ